jgi:hypothetical protein
MNGLLVTRLRLGDLEATAGQPDLALSRYHDAVAIGRPLAARYPDNALWLRNFASALSQAAKFAARTDDDPDAAMAMMRESIAVSRALAERSPADWAARAQLAASLSSLGGILKAAAPPPGPRGQIERWRSRALVGGTADLTRQDNLSSASRSARLRWPQAAAEPFATSSRRSTSGGSLSRPTPRPPSGGAASPGPQNGSAMRMPVSTGPGAIAAYRESAALFGEIAAGTAGT